MIIIFATPKMFSILRDSQRWYADRTFKVAPQQFYQLYTLHAEKSGYIFPCIYLLTVNKNGTTYHRIFRKLLEIEPAFHIMVDFDKA